jgi:hypothetical protein
MIEECEILKLSSEKQAEVHKTIAKMLENGYELKYLVLDSTGDVHYDREAHSDAILMEWGSRRQGDPGYR